MRRFFLGMLVISTLAGGTCLPVKEAPAHLGDTACVTGTVVRVSQTGGGTWFLDFCDSYLTCPFTVVVFARHLRDVGDVRELQGKPIEIHGQLRPWRAGAEIILKDVRQLKGDAARIPPIPKGFDVENRGRFSAGKFGHASKRSTSTSASRKTKPSATPVDEVESDSVSAEPK